MTLLRTAPVVPALDNPEWTAAKRLRHFADDPSLFGRGRKGIDVAALQRRYAPGAVLEQRGSFKVPLGTRADAYERRKLRAVRDFMETLTRMGYAWAGGRIRVYAGMYPHHDLDGVPDFGHREYLIAADFRYMGRPIRVEVDPRWPLKVAERT